MANFIKIATILTMLCIAAFAQQKGLAYCQGGSFIAAEAYGKKPDEARSKAKAEIARTIISQVKSKINMSNSSNETNGVMEESSRYSEISKIESGLTTIVGFQDIETQKLENGEYKSKGYVCTKDAAAPYLKTLQDLARTLKTQTQKADRNSCKSINATYKSIDSVEIVLNYFARMSNEIQTEYETLKQEYQSDGRSGVFFEIEENIFGKKSNVIGSKLREVFSENNCRVERNICKANGGYTLRINATACNNLKYNGVFYKCSACLKVDLLNGRNEIVLSPKIEADSTLAAWNNKDIACEKAFEKSAPEIFTKIKTQISEVCK